MREPSFIKSPSLPKLAWCATIGRQTQKVFYGPFVECSTNWFTEGIWDDDFSIEGLEKALNFFGSGGILNNKTARFMTSTNPVDRILVAISDNLIVVSNSLPLVLAISGTNLVREHDYVEEYEAILNGVRSYNPKFRLEGEKWLLNQYYYGIIDVNFDTLEVKFKNYERPASFNSYKNYVETLNETTKLLVSNAKDYRRAKKIELATTLSSGYDSTAVSTLASIAGVKTAYIRKQSTSVVPSIFKERLNDDGTIAAIKLGLRVVEITDTPKSEFNSDIELAILAGSPAEREVVFLPMAISLDKLQAPSALFMGYHGDKVWDLATSDRYIGSDLIRGDVSGLPLSEARIVAGFLIIPLTFVGAEGISSLIKISKSEEMKPWSIGGSYDRPIPRRIAEESGVPREAFGVRKRAVWGNIGSLTPHHTSLKKSLSSHIGPIRDGLATWQFRSLTVINAVSLRLKGSPVTENAVPQWFERSSQGVFHSSVSLLKDQYMKALPNEFE